MRKSFAGFRSNNNLKSSFLFQILQHSFCHSPQHSWGLSLGVKQVRNIILKYKLGDKENEQI
ncbi:hypothetical protein KsCSTR_29310 [Candidatus Kuenenia stuttgartiensis]|uniref:Uncharacterized protein n=1 Tax=Kuenenia stuttgartiensis TaxID=174633 RepID=Q1Q5T2_KUEST|nr:hypothetical protein KsCSTR_29310 [Candidatus Kuenenia stuttgartiensis]CAJ75367.1 unknown protein [Candidatus Kuenenia stuttgartiensis]